jgi:branched-chain amino acid transport system permease protein
MQEILTALGLDAPGAKQVFYGLCLLVVVMALPDGVWPWLAGKLGMTKPRP